MLNGEHCQYEPALRPVQPRFADEPARPLDTQRSCEIDPGGHGSDSTVDVTTQRRGDVMEFEVSCDCGWSFRGSEDEVVTETIAHGRSVHQIELTRDQAREAARPVEPGDEGDG
jgi:predicted small metal-binding protein